MSSNNSNQFDDQQFQSGRGQARGDFNDSANYDPGVGGTDDDNTFAGSHGGSGTGQAGGYGGSGQQRQAFGGGDDSYGGSDPGMAGNRGPQDTQDYEVPGAGRMGGGQQQYDSGDQYSGSTGRGAGATGSRGYERDTDEYGDSGAQGGKQSMGSKVMGGVEKMAGKMTGKTDLAAKGEERQTGNF
ncbi:hypothetical protein BV22DRAFT_1128885 [Leucogyrophana mollusca]|uniref:Uncharacterized protein n=1 Tax=Leucogyrophana mollusca TaxID=85980 RepID=A0ACB8BL42_9AGAM|nr:hypothetical protein BV22DRAFT_1128885 [Leucogyrophana mollusca]